MKSLYRLDQFDRVLALRNRDGLPYLLIGGQAVNFWAGLYAIRESALAELKPFTSEDIDFKGGRADVEHIAAQLKLRAVLPGKIGMTALAGSIPFTWGDIESNIEVVRVVPGAPQNLESRAIQVEANGQTLRVMDPVSLFVSKLELCSTVSQENRQDIRHLRACLKTQRGPAAREFGGGQGGEAGASPNRAATAESTRATGKRPAARRVFSETAHCLRCSSLTDPSGYAPSSRLAIEPFLRKQGPSEFSDRL
jgi:hypothetical protein